MAEEKRFELLNGFPSPVFKTGAFSRSATPPQTTTCASRAVLIRRGVVYKKQKEMQTLFSFYCVDLMSIVQKGKERGKTERRNHWRSIANIQIQKKPLIA